MEKFLPFFADVLQKDPNEVHADDFFRDYEEWDSLAVLSLGAAVNAEYGVVISRSAYDGLKTVADIFSFVEQEKA